VFFTEPADHFGCPVGAYTHGIDLPPEKVPELERTIGMMVQLEYIRTSEIPAIPRLKAAPGAIVYSRLANAPFDPDVVLVRGNAKQIMLLAEAATAAGVGGSDTMGRPTCAALPAALGTGRGISSLGCIGNRVYMELADDEMYYVLPASKVGDLAVRLGVIVRANAALEAWHRDRASARPCLEALPNRETGPLGPAAFESSQRS